MALCSICSRDATIILSRQGGDLQEPVAAQAYCTECWEREGHELARLLRAPEWRLDVHDPALTGIPRDRVELFLTLERILPAAESQALADGLRQHAAQTGRPLPPELRDLVIRHSRPST